MVRVSGRVDAILQGVGERLRTVGTSTRAAIAHDAEFGRALERSLAAALEVHLPRRFAVTTGFVVDGMNSHSTQQDILIYDAINYPSYPFPLGSDPTGHLLVPESVYAAISVKSAIGPGDMAEHVRWAGATKDFVSIAIGEQWPGLAVVVAFRSEGKATRRRDSYFAKVRGGAKQLDLVCALDAELLLDASRFGIDRDRGVLQQRGQIEFDDSSDACVLTPDGEVFVHFYQLLLFTLMELRLPVLLPASVMRSATPTSTAPEPARPTPTPPPGKEGFHSKYFSESEFLLRRPGDRGQFAIGFVNAGTVPWIKGRMGQQASLATARPLLNTEDFEEGWADGWLAADRYAAQDADLVLPGQIGFFIYNFRVPDDAPNGLHYFYLRPIIEGVGPMEDEGAYQVVNVHRPANA